LVVGYLMSADPVKRAGEYTAASVFVGSLSALVFFALHLRLGIRDIDGYAARLPGR
jgi:hypothetical protein